MLPKRHKTLSFWLLLCIIDFAMLKWNHKMKWSWSSWESLTFRVWFVDWISFSNSEMSQYSLGHEATYSMCRLVCTCLSHLSHFLFSMHSQWQRKYRLVYPFLRVSVVTHANCVTKDDNYISNWANAMKLSTSKLTVHLFLKWESALWLFKCSSWYTVSARI